MKYIDAEKLIAEIRKLCSESCISESDDYYEYAKSEIIDIITSLQQEQPNKYETALEKARKWMPNVNQGGHAILIDIFPELGEGLDPRYGGRKQEQPEVDLEEAARHVYESWMGGTMDDVRRDMVELGKALNAIKEEKK